MKRVNIKKITIMMLGVMILGNLVACGDKKVEESDTALTTVIADKANIKIVNIDGEDKKYVIDEFAAGMASQNLNIRVKSYIKKVGVEEEKSQYTTKYYGHKTDEKYGKSDWIISEKKSEKEETTSVNYKYIFNKDLLNGSVDIKDTGITEFVRNTTQVPLTGEEVKLLQEKFIAFQITDTGSDRIRINQEDTYYSVVLEYDNVEKIIKTYVYLDALLQE